MAQATVQCVVVEWLPSMTNGMIKRLDDAAVYMTNRKSEAWGYPDVRVYITNGTWYIPTDHPFATWLMVKHNFPIRDIHLSLI